MPAGLRIGFVLRSLPRYFAVFALARRIPITGIRARRADLVLTQSAPLPRLPAKPAVGGKIFTISEGTSESQRLAIGRTISGLPVR